MPERDKALVLFLVDTGARSGGVVSLTIDQVNSASQTVELIEKGEKSRIVPVSGVTLQALQTWLAVRPVSQSRHVFLNRHGQPLTGSGLYQVLARIAKRAGVEGRFNPHAFRHFFGRKWMESGGDIAPLSDMLGHTQIGITKQFYLRFDIETVRKQHRQHGQLAGWEG